MITGQKLLRDNDSKQFTVVELAQWSLIRSKDGETDYVKWYGGQGDVECYVSADKNCCYKTGSGKVDWDSFKEIVYRNPRT